MFKPWPTGLPSINPFFIFLHIPKTAGTTLGSIVDAQFGRRRVITYYNQTNRHLIDHLGVYLADPHHNFDAIIGHFGMEIAATLLDRPAIYVTFFRDPVSRTLSDYYERRSTRPQDFFREDGREISICESINENPSWYANLQTRYLAGMAHDGCEVDEADLNHALDNLEDNLDFVGIVEDFDNSISQLMNFLGWQSATYNVENTGGDYPSPKSDLNEAIAANNQLDLVLYQHALKRFKKQKSNPSLLKFAQPVGEIGPPQI